MSTTRLFYAVLGCGVGPSPATGYHFHTGFNNVYTGANSGYNLVQQLQRLQSISDDFTINRQNISQLGQVAIVSREILDSPQVNLQGSYYVADLSNERVLGLYVSGDRAALTNILDKSQAEKNYFIGIAPQGQDLINWTGQSQVICVTNGFLASWSTEGSVGNIPTSNFSVQGLNWATYTGSKNQPVMAVDVSDGSLVEGVNFSLPTFTSGISNTVSALRPIDITLDISNSAIGLAASDIKVQSYNISFDLNLQGLNKLGSRFAYSREIQFPVTLSASITAYFGDVVTGSLANILCNDAPYNLAINLKDPCSENVGVRYILRGMKVDSQSFGSQDIGSIASSVTLNYSTTIGGPTDQNNNLFLSGRNV
jgi:hypothetical protein